jgi:3-hydroxyacyl-CoA dehydrogenase/enoyl-CoA hydratase/3-hydroxybutyryl-CoA epimerase
MDASPSSDPVRCVLDADRVMTVWFDVPGKPVNALSAVVLDGLDAAVRRIEAESPAGVVLASGKPRSFIAGADLFELRELPDDDLDGHLARGQQILDRLEAVRVPTVAALNGDALGGGLEVALACRFRVAADEPRAKLGLPETTLGLLPAWGGTIRLPRLVGLEKALALMVPGKTIPPSEAAALGIVDRVMPSDALLAEAKRLALAPPAARAAHAADSAACREICDRFRASTRARSGDHLPAPLRLIDVVETGVTGGREAGAAAERRGLVDVRATPAGRNLMRLFFLRTAAKKRAAAEAAGTARPVRTAVVIGGGTMGAGIATALAAAGVDVHVVEADEHAAMAVAARLAGGAPVRVTSDWSPVAAADLVVEAVVEDLPAKVDVFRRIDAAARPDAVLATNTSSLSVASIAAATRDPARVIGLHFFNPVAKMPLVEVVRSPVSAADALATGVAVATALGKTPVVCRDAPGFIVNRVLFPYLREAVVVAAEGADVAAIDAATRAWGMPMGPYALLDEIGLDVSLFILRALEQALGLRLAPPPLLAAAVAKGWLGRKSGRGFYDHPPEGRPVPNASWAELGPAVGGESAPVAANIVERRLIAPMADEARRVLVEQVVASADAVDLATVLGIGFPAFRGGLATFAGLG